MTLLFGEQELIHEKISSPVHRQRLLINSSRLCFEDESLNVHFDAYV